MRCGYRQACPSGWTIWVLPGLWVCLLLMVLTTLVLLWIFWPEKQQWKPGQPRRYHFDARGHIDHIDGAPPPSLDHERIDKPDPERSHKHWQRHDP